MTDNSQEQHVVTLWSRRRVLVGLGLTGAALTAPRSLAAEPGEGGPKTDRAAGPTGRYVQGQIRAVAGSAVEVTVSGRENGAHLEPFLIEASYDSMMIPPRVGDDVVVDDSDDKVVAQPLLYLSEGVVEDVMPGQLSFDGKAFVLEPYSTFREFGKRPRGFEQEVEDVLPVGVRAGVLHLRPFRAGQSSLVQAFRL